VAEPAQNLSDFFAGQGSQVWQATGLAQTRSLVEHQKPGLVVADWGPPDNGWLSLLEEIRQRLPNTKVLLTRARPGPQPEDAAQTGAAHLSTYQPIARADVVPVFPSENGSDSTLEGPGLMGRLKRLAWAIIDLEFIWPPEE
jgi:CheY-like chemotaxis protein